MANWSDLKASVAEVIKTNGNQEITGAILQGVLNTIISNVGANSSFVGVATPSTNPGTPDGNVFYIAVEAGTYSNFGGLELRDGLNILLWKNNAWTAENLNSKGSGNLITLKCWNISSTSKLNTNDYYYGSDKKIHRVIVPGKQNEIVDFDSNAIYLYENRVYTYNGIELIPISTKVYSIIPKYIGIKYDIPISADNGNKIPPRQSMATFDGYLISPIPIYSPFRFYTLNPSSSPINYSRVECDAVEKAWVKIVNKDSERSVQVVLKIKDNYANKTFSSYFFNKLKLVSNTDNSLDITLDPVITTLENEPEDMVEITISSTSSTTSSSSSYPNSHSAIQNYSEIYPLYTRFNAADVIHENFSYLAKSTHTGGPYFKIYVQSIQGVTFNGVLVRILKADNVPDITGSIMIRVLSNTNKVNIEKEIPIDYINSIYGINGETLGRYYDLPLFFDENISVKGSNDKIEIQIWRADKNNLVLQLARDDEYVYDANSPLYSDSTRLRTVLTNSLDDKYTESTYSASSFYATLIQSNNKGVIDTDIIMPKTIYSVLNDIKNHVELGNNNENQTSLLLMNKHIAATIYLDHCFVGYDREPIYRFEYGAVRLPFYSNLTKNTINDGQEKIESIKSIRVVGENAVTKHFSINHVSTLASVGKNTHVKLLIISASTGAYIPLDFYDNYEQDNSFIIRLKELFEYDKIDNDDSGYDLFVMGYTGEGGNIHKRTINYANVNREITALGYCTPGASLKGLVSGQNFSKAYDSLNSRFSIKHFVDIMRTRNDDTMEKYTWGNPNLGSDVTEYDLTNGRVDVCTPTHVIIMLAPNDAASADRIQSYATNVESVINSLIIDYPNGEGGTNIKLGFCMGDSGVISYPSIYKRMLSDNYDWLCRKGYRGADDNRHYGLWHLSRILNSFDTQEYKNKNVYVIPTFFVGNPETAGRKINTPSSLLLGTDDYYIGAYDNTHIRAMYHCDWAYQIYSWIKSTLV